MIEKIQAKITEIPTDQLIEWVSAVALEVKSTDIHFEAAEKNFKIRLRIDGVLEEIANIPKELFLPVVSQIKELSGMKLDVHDRAQDGRFKIDLPDQRSFDTRVSVIPSGYGESVIIRLLRADIAARGLGELGLREQSLEIVKDIIQSPNGILFVTGPTSAGKTTTLYAILQQLNKPGVKIFTIEDPIEYRFEGIIQTQVSVEAGYTFLDALRALLRQNPNIIMLGEIRDSETAKAAIQASLTGHLVLTTLHTNNSAEAIQRLDGLGIPADDVATSVRGIVAQRLVRRLCPDCKKIASLNTEQKNKLEQEWERIPENYKKGIKFDVNNVFEPQKCDKCNQRGFKGQLGIYEVLKAEEKIKKSILSRQSSSDIYQLAMNEGMLTMHQDGILRVLEGVTTLTEVYRATGE
jgi:type II secretory ATPase GspE/PulE/Tfp pilus assembly ATPase PilB-like protein